MLYIAGLLASFSGLFHSAGVHELGSAGAEMCQYGNAFCDKPHHLLVAAGLAAAWRAFVRAGPIHSRTYTGTSGSYA